MGLGLNKFSQVGQGLDLDVGDRVSKIPYHGMGWEIC